jgi:hypothetical protein
MWCRWNYRVWKGHEDDDPECVGDEATVFAFKVFLKVF